MSKIRTFIAIDIPEEIRNEIARLQPTLKELGGRVSWTKPKNIHLTLKFLGDTEENLIGEIEKELKGIMGFSEEPLVSCDYVGNTLSSIVDAEFTKVVDGNLVKILSWYDNEMGYSARCVDLIKML